MSNIKKQFQELHKILEDNKGKKVSTIMDQLMEIMVSKNASNVEGSTIRRAENGTVTHIYCYFHKRWEDLTEVEYGKKASASSGFNTMCKQGVSAWTKRQRVAAKGKEELTNKLIEGELTAEELKEGVAILEAARTSTEFAEGEI